MRAIAALIAVVMFTLGYVIGVRGAGRGHGRDRGVSTDAAEPIGALRNAWQRPRFCSGVDACGNRDCHISEPAPKCDSWSVVKATEGDG